MASKTLADQLSEQTRESELFETLDDRRLRCLACGHRCPIAAGFAGVCKVRFNRDGKLLAPHGYVNTAQCDPIEKKPFFHVRPGSARAQLRHAGMRPALWLLPELGHVPGAARSAFRPRFHQRTAGADCRMRLSSYGASAGDQHLQRAADHRRMGGGGLSRSARSGPADGLRLQWKRHAGSSRAIFARGWTSTKWT